MAKAKDSPSEVNKPKGTKHQPPNKMTSVEEDKKSDPTETDENTQSWDDENR